VRRHRHHEAREHEIFRKRGRAPRGDVQVSMLLVMLQSLGPRERVVKGLVEKRRDLVLGRVLGLVHRQLKLAQALHQRAGISACRRTRCRRRTAERMRNRRSR